MTKIQDEIVHKLNTIVDKSYKLKDVCLELECLIKDIEFYGNSEIEQLKKLLAEKDLIIKRYLEKEGEK